MRIIAVMALLVVLGGCANSRNSAAQAIAASGLVGDEKGGKIPDGVSRSNNAYAAATAHCKNYGKNAFITKWDSPSDRGAIVFECK